MELYAYAEYMLNRKLKIENLPGSTPRGYPEESPKEKKFIGGTADTLGICWELIGGTDRIYSAYAKFYPRRGFLYPSRAGTPEAANFFFDYQNCSTIGCTGSW